MSFIPTRFTSVCDPLDLSIFTKEVSALCQGLVISDLGLGVFLLAFDGFACLIALP
jgi:hypothetical protein